MLLEGIFLPLLTPFYPDGRVYLRKLEHNVDHYSRTPAAGMLVLGQAGEADGLMDAEGTEVLATAIGAASREKVMIAAIGRESVLKTLALAEIAAGLGYDALAVRAPEFVADPAMQLPLMTYFGAVADGASLPVILVSQHGRPLSVEVMSELAGHPNVIGAIVENLAVENLAELRARTAGITHEVTVTTVFRAVTGRMLRYTEPGKPSSFISAESLGGGGATLAVGMPTQTLPTLKTRTKRVNFQLLSSSTGEMLTAWRAGAVGAVPGLAVCAPQACCEVYQAFRDGDLPLAEEKQQRITSAAELMDGPAGIAAMKHGCDYNGYFGGRPRLPLLALTEAERKAVEHALAGLRN